MAARTAEEILALYTPQMPAERWSQIGPFVRSVISEAYPAAERAKVSGNRIGVVAGLVSWALDQGLPLDVEQIFAPATVNRYAVTVPGFAETSRSSRRTLLTTVSRRVTRRAPWEPRRDPLDSRSTPFPYTDAQARWLVECVDMQRTSLRYRGLGTAVVLGLGAGLRTAEMVGVLGTDVTVRNPHLLVTVTGEQRPRTVPVADRYGPLLAELARNAKSEPLFRAPPIPRIEFVPNLLHRCEIPEPLRPVTVARMRATWAVALLTTVPMPTFLRLAGYNDIDQIRGLLPYIPAAGPQLSRDELDHITQAVLP
ncbi:site-specific integrase [Antrihabitans stalactiti]|uniref:Site-specific integrase n=1 Tax=Antrihabitans stalactiti TaxID=2584121 RepID=A0A848KJ46_9NOCA|nr:site-specific integrase [Antrihabitans stalactiti]NMN99103.1 site-specific integrase [Antrihabitans stalactiti]